MNSLCNESGVGYEKNIFNSNYVGRRICGVAFKFKSFFHIGGSQVEYLFLPDEGILFGNDADLVG